MNFITQLRLGDRWRLSWQSASLLRSWLETLALCAGLVVCVAWVYAPITDSVFRLSFLFFVNPLCALYYAWRLRPAQGSKLRQMGWESVWLVMVAMLTAGVGGLVVVSVQPVLWPINSLLNLADLLPQTPIAFTILLFPYLFFRTFGRLWVWWGRLQARYLLWALMNSHLVAVAVLQLIVIVPLFVAVAIWITPNRTLVGVTDQPLAQFFWRVNTMLPLFGLAILAVCLVLAALIPVSALVSYFLSRRIKQRLDALILAARSAGDGDYRVRVPVSGQDEISTLQRDFNSMIDRLERNVTALHAERAKVVTLLNQRHELVANVSHDLRTPLATIRAYLETAQRRNQDQPSVPLTAADLLILDQESAALQRLIDDLFTLSRAETEHLALRIEPTDLPSLIRRIVATVAPLAWRTQRVEISTQLPAEMAHIAADSQRLEQAIRNLIHNSLRHTLPGGIIVISASQHGSYAEIQVRDSGGGIAPEDLPYIWERFYHGANNGGTGLGLALVKSLIEAMSGSVAVQSTPGEGACFTLTLPLSDPATLSASTPPQTLL